MVLARIIPIALKMSHFVRLVALVSIVTNAIAASDSSITSQVRVAYHGDAGMVVSWNTFDQLSNPTVNYGLSPVCVVPRLIFVRGSWSCRPPRDPVRSVVATNSVTN